MVNYEPLKLEVILLQRTDIIQTSNYDNIGGIPDGWTNGFEE